MLSQRRALLFALKYAYPNGVDQIIPGEVTEIVENQRQDGHTEKPEARVNLGCNIRARCLLRDLGIGRPHESHAKDFKALAEELHPEPVRLNFLIPRFEDGRITLSAKGPL